MAEMTEGACVYVIGPVDDCVKVGLTGDVPVRLYHLRREYGSGIDCLFSVPVVRRQMRAVEKRAHEILSEHWRERELFAATPEQAISAIKQAVDEIQAIRSGRDNEPNRTTLPMRGVRFDPEVREALDKAAKADKRSASSMVEIIVEAYLREKGFLKDSGQ